ncbi:PREDICTED: adenylate kinase 4, mitochondrial [Cyprinodon variegatus]|uniref:adenylate kinase 4, mitochondrial n=1 Tax=Cyprinodon variegatus TaxID=28743 RepID=UPI0007424FAC|nr:PREDICTED: adenylate kinase 4, mitochondrial [Cyprinodon variegatus]
MAKFFRAAVLGPPGSGKGTICKRIAESFGLQYLSSGHFLREGIAANTEAGVLAKTYIERGMLVPDQVMTRLMLPKLEQLKNHSWLLDGFPRTLAQAQALNNLYQMDLVISLNIPYETLRERLSDRWIHPASGRVYNMGFNPPRVQNVNMLEKESISSGLLLSDLRSQGILHSFSGTETDKIWPYINTLLSTKMPSDAHPTPTP